MLTVLRREHQALSPLNVEEVWGGACFFCSRLHAQLQASALQASSPRQSTQERKAGRYAPLVDTAQVAIGCRGHTAETMPEQGCLYMVHDAAAFKLPGSQISGQAKARRARVDTSDSSPPQC